jgi:drug/metabolite transporter (DMT)-like permease
MKRSLVQLHIAVLLAGFTGVLGKLITLNEGLLVLYRLMISSATMWLVFWLTRRLQKISMPDAARLTGIGFLSALHWLCFYGSIKSANVSVALICFSSVGFFTALLEPVFSKKNINMIEVLLGLLVMAGIAVIFRFDPQYKTGIILGVACAVLLALMVIFMKGFTERINSQTILTYQLTGGFVTLSLFLPLYLRWFPPTHIIPTLPDFLWLLVLSWFCSVIAFQLSVNSLKKLSAFTVNLSFNLEPVYGIVLAFLIYHENKQLGWSFFVGLSLIVLALGLQMSRLAFQARQAKKVAEVEELFS